VPLHRTITFHLGLLPLVLLLWAWADSVRNSTTWFRCQRPEQAFMVGMAGSNFAFGTLDLKPETEHRRILTLTPDYGRIERYRIPGTKHGNRIFPSLTGPDRSFEVHHHLTLNARRLPFWFLIACYLPLWLAASFFHARRKQKRHLASLPSSSPAQPQSDL
jgi:hypothetical protein